MENSTKNIKFYLNEIITIIIMFIGFFMPETTILPHYGIEILFIFIGLLWGWSTVGLIAPSLLGLIAMAFTEGFTIKTVWQAGIGSEVVLLVILFCIFSKWLETVGFTDTMMNWFLTRKIFLGKPWLFIGSFLFLIYALGFLTSVFPAIFIGWACSYKLVETLGYEKRSPFCAFLIFNITVLGNLGDSSKPWGAWGLTTMNTYNGVVENPLINYGGYIGWYFIMSMIILIIAVIFGKFIMKINMNNFVTGDYREAAKAYNFDTAQKFAASLLVGMIILLFLPGYLPDGGLKTIVSTIGTLGTISLVLIIAGAINKANGEPFFNFNRIASYGGVNWNPVILLTATVPLGAALKSPEAGVMQLFSDFAVQHLEGFSPFVFYVIIAVFLGLLTQVAHNLVVLVSIAPIFAQVGITLGMSPEVIMMISSLMLTAALGSPAGSTRSGMLFGNVEYISMADSYKLGWLSLLAHIVVCCAIGIPLGMMIF